MASNKLKIERSVNLRNKAASHEYNLLDFYVAGMVLRGSEIKVIRMQKVNMQDAYCQVHNGEVYVVNLHISPYEKMSFNPHNPKADRKLLLSKKEIQKIERALKDQGMTLIPTRLFINDRGLAKLEIATAKGKKLFDKREDIKARDIEREMRRG
jgi:SsrA-binding protein